jgi:hypothetical protein
MARASKIAKAMKAVVSQTECEAMIAHWLAFLPL